MNKLLTIALTLILCFNLLPLNIAYSASATYYVDIENGNDANNGLSENMAWKTNANFSTTAFAAGDTILFRRGQKWDGFSFSFPQNNMKLGAYGEGERPILSGAVSVTGWEHVQGSIYKIPCPEVDRPSPDKPLAKPLLIKIDNRLIRYERSEITLENLGALPANKYTGIEGYVYYNSPDGSPEGKITEMQVRGTLLTINQLKNITVENLHLTMGGGGAILINSGKTENIYITNNEISFIESGYSVDGAVTISSSVKCYISKNIIHDVFGDGIMGWHVKDSVFSENHVTRVFIGQNTGGDCIQISGRDSFGENAAPNNKILNNFTSMEGTDSGKGCIIHENGYGVVISGNICLYGHFGVEANSSNGIVENNFCAFQGVEGSAMNWTAGLYMSEAMDITNMTWRNNIVYGCKPYGFNSVANGGTNCIRNLNFYNNTIINSGTPFNFSQSTPFYGNIKNNIFWSTTSKVYSIPSVLEGQTTEINYNLIGPIGTESITFNGGRYSSLSTYREVTGNDIHSVSAEPLFADVENADLFSKDFRLYSNSPGVDMGCDVGLTSDYEGAASPQGDGFNMGAFETTVYTSEPPPDIPDEPAPESGEPKYVKGLYAYEDFGYRPTSTLDDAGNLYSGWSGNWRVSTESESNIAKVGTESLSYEGVNSIGYKCLLNNSMSRNLRTDLPQYGTFWFSFLYDFGKNNSDKTINLGNKISIQKRSDKSGGYWSIRNSSNKLIEPKKNTDGSYLNPNYNANTGLILLKAEIQPNKTSVNMWVCPNVSDGESELPAADFSTTFSEAAVLPSISFYLGSINTANWITIDEIRLADNFNAAVSGTYAMENDVVVTNIRLTSNAVTLQDSIYGLPEKIVCEPSYYNAIPESTGKKVYSLFNIYSDDMLILQKTDTLTLSEGDVRKDKISVAIPAELRDDEFLSLSGCTIKYFIWDYDTLKPYCKPYIISVVAKEHEFEEDDL